MTGADYVDEKVTLPLRWLLIVVTLAALPIVWTRRYKQAIILVAGFFVLQLALPGIVHAVYVRPNEISIERPYIERHIEATSIAFGLNRNAQELPFTPNAQATVDPVQDATLLDNVRLWDLRAYNATITQIQALRPYYTFPATDVDRYFPNGRIKQVLLSPREIDVTQLSAEASQSWINPRFIYTHGFGAVMSEVNKITPDGLPVLLIENAPPEIKTAGFQLTRPEIYYGEKTQDPVFVHTAREEFDYPSGDQNKYSTYQGSGGFPVGSILLKTAAAISQGEPNIIFTSYLTGESRMMIHRNVMERLQYLAGFLTWDQDPYLVITDDGRLVWMVDGYTTSLSHPYSATLPVAGLEDGANYMRNAVKATVDAYNGKISLYVFDPSDPIIQAYQHLFPKLFQPASEMPADLRRHARYPEALFQTQAEAYRTFHMRDPQVFYNKEDIWDIAHNLFGQSGQPENVQPTYVVATLPGEKSPEFLLILPFTPRGKDNLIGWMAARCDGDHLGNLVFYQLPKQQLMYGPMQIESRIDQDQNISKDLTLWNQQGSHVLRGNIISLPVTGGFLYVESIYIQATEARMPQLKKVVLAMGDRLIYRDNFDQALAELTGGAVPAKPASAAAASAQTPPPAPTRKERSRPRRARPPDSRSSRTTCARTREAGKRCEISRTGFSLSLFCQPAANSKPDRLKPVLLVPVYNPPTMTNASYLSEKFASGLAYARYLQTGTEEQQRRWTQVYDAAHLTDAQKQLVAGFVREMKILIFSGIWCGDCVQQCPLIYRIAEANPSKNRFALRRAAQRKANSSRSCASTAAAASPSSYFYPKTTNGAPPPAIAPSTVTAPLPAPSSARSARPESLRRTKTKSTPLLAIG